MSLLQKKKDKTRKCKKSDNRMMVIHHSNFVPHRSYNIPDGKPKFGGHKLYYSYGYTSEHHITEPLLSTESLSSSEFSDFLGNIDDDDNNGDNININNRLCQYKTVLTDYEMTHKISVISRNNNNNNIVYVNINHDNTLKTDSEVAAMTKHHSVVQRYGLTVPLFKHSLKLQPKILHLTFHGEYDINTNRSIVKFDGTPALPQLLTSSQTFKKNGRSIKYYRDYFAAIARLFEDEMITFINQPKHQITKEPIFAKYTWINTELIFENKPKMRQLLENIVLRRFGCTMTHYRNKKYIVIWYGKWKEIINTKNNRKEIILQQAPNEWLLDEYMLSSICRNRQIDGICRQIKTRYKNICASNQPLLNQLNRNYQQYCWPIMNIAIHEIIPKQVWKWLDNLDDQESDNEDIDNNNHTVMNGELYNSYQRTFELTVSPYIEDDDDIYSNKIKYANPTETEQKILEQRIRVILEDILRDIRQDIIISKGREFESDWLPPPLLNYKILRFKNDSAIYMVRTKVIAKFQRKYKNKYIISFKQLNEASFESHILCGYIPFNEQKQFILDTITFRDEISQIINNKLVSKDKCNIKLLVLLGCHSYQLAKIFEPYIECIICVHPHTQIDDTTCIKFSQYFYKNLSSHNDKKNKLKYIVIKSFQDSIKELKKSCRYDNGCKLHGHIHSHNNKNNINQFHPNDDFLKFSANKQNITREGHLNELKKYKNCEYEHPLQKHYEIPSLIIMRIDAKKYNELKQYVLSKIKTINNNNNNNNNNNKSYKYQKLNFDPSRMNKKTNNNDFNMNSKASRVSVNSIPPQYSKRSTANSSNHTVGTQRGGASIGYEYSQETIINNDYKMPSISYPLESFNNNICADDIDSCLSIDTDICSDIEMDENEINENSIISWEWYESKISADFSYSILKCSSEKTKKIIYDILEKKKYKEEEEINIIFKKQQTLGPILNNNNNNNDNDNDEDSKEYNLRWDVTDLPICCCSIDAPHRVEDKLVLLIDGKQINGRDITLPIIKSNNKRKHHHQRAMTEPAFKREPFFQTLQNMNHNITEPTSPQILDFPTSELINDDYDGDNDDGDDIDHDDIDCIPSKVHDDDGTVICDEIHDGTTSIIL